MIPALGKQSQGDCGSSLSPFLMTKTDSQQLGHGQESGDGREKGGCFVWDCENLHAND